MGRKDQSYDLEIEGKKEPSSSRRDSGSTAIKHFIAFTFFFVISIFSNLPFRQSVAPSLLASLIAQRAFFPKTILKLFREICQISSIFSREENIATDLRLMSRINDEAHRRHSNAHELESPKSHVRDRRKFVVANLNEDRYFDNN